MYIPVAGHFLTLIIPEGKERGTYQSCLYSINTHHLLISPPQTNDRSRIPLAAGTKAILEYRDAKDIPCRFETVVDELPDGDLNVLALKCPQTIERHQRRENLRVPVSWNAELTTPAGIVQAVMNDLSGGGVSLWLPTRQSMDIGQSVEVRFTLSSNKRAMPVRMNAEVVSAQTEDGETRQLCSLKFTSVAEDNRQSIMEFVLNRQMQDIALRNVGRSIVF